MKKLSLILYFLANTTFAFCGEFTQHTHTYTNNGGNTFSIRYLLYTPSNVQDSLPLLIYLHGGSGIGDDLNTLFNNGFPMFLHDGDLGELPCYVIIPQLSSNYTSWNAIFDVLRDLIVRARNTYHISAQKVNITGHSMGGTATWSFVARFPQLFHRVAPASGNVTTNATNLTAFENKEVWALVGSDDNIVSPQTSIDFINALSINNTNARITVFDGATHFDIPTLAYQDLTLGLIDWLCENENVTPPDPPIEIEEYEREQPNDNNYYDLLGHPLQKDRIKKGQIYIHQRKLYIK